MPENIDGSRRGSRDHSSPVAAARVSMGAVVAQVGFASHEIGGGRPYS